MGVVDGVRDVCCMAALEGAGERALVAPVVPVPVYVADLPAEMVASVEA